MFQSLQLKLDVRSHVPCNILRLSLEKCDALAKVKRHCVVWDGLNCDEIPEVVAEGLKK